jgi:hypothetical protein
MVNSNIWKCRIFLLQKIKVERWIHGGKVEMTRNKSIVNNYLIILKISHGTVKISSF